MNDSTPNPYRYAALWRGIGWAMVAAVVVLSLVPQLPKAPSLLGWDKAQHFLAYAVLTFWFCLSYSRHWRWPAFFVALGTLLELLQGFTGIRTTDPFDILANGTGVSIGLSLAFTPLIKSLQKFDDLLSRSCGSSC
ncbi:VanZ family protein [Methylococcus geothermalis]|uniref:VanZ family protein n=1 Tax=Methylococcus geothermalis TaxID=2681310 RepID=A0A858Q834_9GAMM|nr:VanZ family protein [Methylococcus geothermalis]QJD30062.1 VanZ family protein [Methylococcus geothermalis]